MERLTDAPTKLQAWIITEWPPVRLQEESRRDRAGPHPGSVPPCRIFEVRLDQDLGKLLEAWRECNSFFCDHTIHCDPDWISERYKQQKKNVHIYFLEKDGVVMGAVPFVLSKELLLGKLGPSVMAKLPLRILQLQGSTPNLPAETTVYDMLFARILESKFDAIQFVHAKTESLFWSYLQTSPVIQKFFRLYIESGPLPRLSIRLNGSFESYMKKFSPKARKNRLREIKRLRMLGDVQCVRVTKTSEIDAFLEAAYGISRKTWQFARHRWGIGGRDIDVVRSEMQFLAERGWLRCYLLKCGTAPCSYIFGQQYGRTFHTADAGVDRAWRSQSAGTVLFLLALEDLFKENSPQFYDLDEYVKYKEHFANESHLHASAWLFRRRAYPLLASGIYSTCNAISRKASVVLEQLHLKSSLRQLVGR
jgi:hypothetical protein